MGNKEKFSISCSRKTRLRESSSNLTPRAFGFSLFQKRTKTLPTSILSRIQNFCKSWEKMKPKTSCTKPTRSPKITTISASSMKTLRNSLTLLSPKWLFISSSQASCCNFGDFSILRPSINILTETLSQCFMCL